MLVIPDASGARQLSPTDISQFIRLDQSERYLRLRLHERSAGALHARLRRDAAVDPAAADPLDASFEERITIDVARHYPVVNTAIMVSATENDRGYLLATGEFLLDPRRLTLSDLSAGLVHRPGDQWMALVDGDGSAGTYIAGEHFFSTNNLRTLKGF